MRLHALCFFSVLTVAASGLMPLANAAVIIDNTVGETATLLLAGNNDSGLGVRGYEFTVGSTAINVTSATFGLYANATGTGNVGVRLYSGAGTTGSLLQDTGTSVVGLNTIANAGYVTFNMNWALDANTTYSIMAWGSAVDVTPRLADTAESLAISPLVTGNGFYDGASTSPNNYAFKLEAAAVPEPSTWALAGAALASGVAMMRRRRVGHSGQRDVQVS